MSASMLIQRGEVMQVYISNVIPSYHWIIIAMHQCVNLYETKRYMPNMSNKLPLSVAVFCLLSYDCGNINRRLVFQKTLLLTPLRQPWSVNSPLSTKYLFVQSTMMMAHHIRSAGTRLTKASDVTIQRYRNSYAKIEDSKMHISRCMGSRFGVKGALWNFIQNFEPIHCKICILRVLKIWRLTISQIYDILCLSETGPGFIKIKLLLHHKTTSHIP